MMTCMANDTKQRMIDGAVRLLATVGLQGTSFSEVLELTGAPRGSIYHHFPDGKEQLVAAAVDSAGAHANEVMAGFEGAPAREVVEGFLGMWRQLLVLSGFRAGCSVLAVTTATDSPELLTHVADVFRGWRRELAILLTRGGLAEADALAYAALLIASTEGAVVLSRAEQSLEPFELVADELLARVDALSGRAGSAS
jgi:TetR/AcrR family transcriptional repressor of lmrAB and yxaGH operons